MCCMQSSNESPIPGEMYICKTYDNEFKLAIFNERHDEYYRPIYKWLVITGPMHSITHHLNDSNQATVVFDIREVLPLKDVECYWHIDETLKHMNQCDGEYKLESLSEHSSMEQRVLSTTKDDFTRINLPDKEGYYLCQRTNGDEVVAYYEQGNRWTGQKFKDPMSKKPFYDIKAYKPISGNEEYININYPLMHGYYVGKLKGGETAILRFSDEKYFDDAEGYIVIPVGYKEIEFVK